MVRARVVDAAGKRSTAVQEYRLLARVLAHADRELLPYASEAHEALKRLEAAETSGGAK